MNVAVETIDGGSATLDGLRRVGMARFLWQVDSGRGDYTAQRFATLGNPTVDELLDEAERRSSSPSFK